MMYENLVADKLTKVLLPLQFGDLGEGQTLTRSVFCNHFVRVILIIIKLLRQPFCVSLYHTYSNINLQSACQTQII